MNDDKPPPDDKDLFRKIMRDVKPLKKGEKVYFAKEKKLGRPRKEVFTEPSSYYLSDYTANPVAAEDILSYAIPSFPNKRMRQLKQAEIALEAKLDMHGLQVDAARESLLHFINQQYQLERRCCLIIHGKGGQLGREPVLKNMVNQWLKQLPQVLAFHSAQPKHGGTGALYVLLKKNMHSD